MAVRVEASLLPLANVTSSKLDGVEVWVSQCDDPQFRVIDATSGTRPMKAGWYEFVVQASAIKGWCVSPCLYPDYGDGMEEASKIFLPEPEADGSIRAIVCFPRAVHVLRFDPSTLAVSFSLSGFRFRRLGRVAAHSAMLREISRSGDSKNRLRRVGGALRGVLRGIAEGGLAAGASQLHDRYWFYRGISESSYQVWTRRYDALTSAQLRVMAHRSAALEHKPLMSIVLPVYQTPEKWLRACLDSVLAQVYQDWELCVVDDCSPSGHVRQILEEYAARDSRIRPVFAEKNGHISITSNAAVAMARGEFIVLLDHDDELPRHALLEVAQAVNDNPRWQLIFSDEDKIDELGRRFDPYFKPDWNYELFLQQNCISHLGVYRTDLVRKAGGFSVGMEGSQDWDLALRCIELLDPDQIGHIPKVLYHWRAIPGSTALATGEKSYAQTAGMRAVQAHLDRMGKGGKVEALPNGSTRFRVRYPVGEHQPKVSLVIPTRDKVDLLRVCVDSILEKTAYTNYEIVVVDNQSQEQQTLDYFAGLASEPRVRVLSYNAPFNYSAINNFAVAQCDAELIGLINNDIEVISPDWLGEMVSHAIRPGVGAVGAMLYYPNDTIQHAGIILGFQGVGGHAYLGKPRGWEGQMARAQLVQQLVAVTAACLIVRRQTFLSVGGLDERFSVAFNDVDLCLKIHAAGYRNVWTPYAELYHHESASRGAEDTPEKIERFNGEIALMKSRWPYLMNCDPAYNRNLAIVGETFDLAFPPR